MIDFDSLYTWRAIPIYSHSNNLCEPVYVYMVERYLKDSEVCGRGSGAMYPRTFDSVTEADAIAAQLNCGTADPIPLSWHRYI